MFQERADYIAYLTWLGDAAGEYDGSMSKTRGDLSSRKVTLTLFIMLRMRWVMAHPNHANGMDLNLTLPLIFLYALARAFRRLFAKTRGSTSTVGW